MSPVRGSKPFLPLVGAVIALAAVIVFASNAFARRDVAGAHSPTVVSHSGSGSGSGASSGAGGTHDGPTAITAVSPAIGLAPGVTSPSAAGLPVALADLPKLSSKQLAGQRIIYSYPGLEPPTSLLTLISRGEAAGVIFFGQNVGTKAHLAAVVRELEQADASKGNPVHLPLLLMTDQEGGVVRRLPGPPVLSEKEVGEAAHPWAAATAAGAGAASNLRSVGLNVNLAPVLDVFRKPGNFIDEFGRSFSNNPVKAAKLGALYATAEQKGDVAATVKHFPGLGAAATAQNTDERPVTLRLTLSAIRSIDELPYISAVAAHVKLVMVSWAIYPALDRKFPAGLSSTIVRGELRNRLRFGGVTITDALSAGALVPFGGIASRATLAARAGMDALLCAGQRVTEGYEAMLALNSDYLHGTVAYDQAFKAAAERVMALRATLPG
jgi:beta-N-acetylhexosaminidase